MINRDIRCSSAQSLLGSMPDGCADLIIVDPPDNIGIGQSDSDDDAPIDEMVSALYPVAEHSARVLHLGGATVVLGNPHIMSAWEVAASWANLRPAAEMVILWDGERHTGVFAGVSSFTTAARWHIKPGLRFNQSLHVLVDSNVIVCHEVPFKHRVAPVQRPVELFNYFISLLSKPNDWVIDPFCGTGSALVAAEICGRRWIGGDVKPEMCAIATRRTNHIEIEETDLQPLHLWLRGQLIPVAG